MIDHNELKPAAIDADNSVLLVSLELSKKTWLATSLAPASSKMLKRQIVGGDAPALVAHIERIKARAEAQVGRTVSVVIVQEAGMDGFWLHRLLRQHGFESWLVDPASVAVPRRHRRAKTDVIDGETLIRVLMAFRRGEPRVCSMVTPPSPEDEDRRRVNRERKTLIKERVEHVNRIKGLLFTQGVRGYEPLNQDRRVRFEELKTGDGRGIPSNLRAEICRELDRLELILTQLAAVERQRDALVGHSPTSAPPKASLLRIRGIGPEFASVLWNEAFYRSFKNRRQVAAYAGLAPSPWQSGAVDHEQGVSRSGNVRLRTTMVELAWLWVRYQPDSTLTQWFLNRVRADRGRVRRVMVIALARKLLVALWRYCTSGILPEGARLKPCAAH